MKTDIIRVFASKNKWTPTDDLAFFDEPPLFELPKLSVYVSVVFSWDTTRGKALAAAWQGKAGTVRLGGPAFGNPGFEFTPGLFLKEGVTITSRGCPKKCPWCLVPKREGKLQEIAIKPGHIVQDNNILACSEGHFERVCEMLSEQKKAAEFKGGLDIDYLTEWHVEQLKQIRVKELWVACDTDAGLAKLDKAADLLSDFPQWKKNCYVLMGYEGESLHDAHRRASRVFEKGFRPFAQLWRNGEGGSYTKEWKDLARTWSRSAIYMSPGFEAMDILGCMK